jgi:LmbE family N-acetylglucosaminyl deacetylase
MRALSLDLRDGPPHVVAIGAHPDDVEIGCGGTLRRLAAEVGGLTAHVVLATGTPERVEEAQQAAGLFMPGCEVTVTTGGLPDGRLPAHWGQVKALLEQVASGPSPALVLAPHTQDAHQDHRTVADIVTTVWRDHLVLRYEIPKWDGDLGRPTLYVPLSDEQMRDKVRLLHKAYPSQVGRDWFDEEMFTGLARVRGMECRARFAEAFTTSKATLTW